MIYEFPQEGEEVRQGDIFFRMPRLSISLDSIIRLSDNGEEAPEDWSKVAFEGGELVLAAGVRVVPAIVITQDCDVMRAEQLTLCEIKPLDTVLKSLGTKPKDWVTNVIKQMRQNLKWFYLPPDERVGFTTKMAVDFQVTLTVGREDLMKRLGHRRGRLNTEAYQHFRERLAQFYRRYPVDEWYPLTYEEFELYKKGDNSIQPRPWQVPPAGSEGAGGAKS